jgi:hypothetical protein
MSYPSPREPGANNPPPPAPHMPPQQAPWAPPPPQQPPVGTPPQQGGYGAAPSQAPWGAPPPQAPWGTPGQPGGDRTDRRLLGWIGAIVCVFGALILIAGGIFGAYVYEGASAQTDNSQAYGPVLWRNKPAEEIFPKTLAAGSKHLSEGAASGSPSDPKRGQWQRLGIAPGTSCTEALGSTTELAAKKAGCEAAPRATYVDPSGNVIATVALIVSTDKGSDELGSFLANSDDPRSFKPGVHAYPVPGTSAAEWSDKRRNGAGGAEVVAAMPYGVAVTTGASDGHLAGHLPAPWSERYSAGADRQPWSAAATNLATALSDHLNASLGAA